MFQIKVGHFFKYWHQEVEHISLALFSFNYLDVLITDKNVEDEEIDRTIAKVGKGADALKKYGKLATCHARKIKIRIYLF